VTFAVLGGAYFIWRWAYFGHPLPNPFYKKGGGNLHPHAVVQSLRNVLEMAWPLLATLGIALFSPKLRKTAVFTLIPVLGFASIWILLSDEMNYWGRFQYAVVPILLLSWPGMAHGVASELGWSGAGAPGRRHRLLGTIALGATGVVALYLLRKDFPVITLERTGLSDVGTILKRYKGKGYQLVASEAGLLPLYSEWTSIDPWGLNDKWIAHNGRVTPEYLDRYKPELILFHGYSSPLNPEEGVGALGEEWRQMVLVLRSYAESRRYELAAVFGRSPFDTHWYYVRTDFEHGPEITEQIRQVQYESLGVCMDFAKLARALERPAEGGGPARD
jgi:hypothetical protein